MLRSLAGKALRDQRRSLLWWSLGLVGFVAMYAAIYPTVRDMPDLNAFLEAYPEALRAFIAGGGELDLASAAGYLQAEAFSFLVPLIFLVFAIGAGAGAIAGEEERGTMEVLLAAPVPRWRVVLEKLLAISVATAVLGVVLWLALWAGARAVEMEISAWQLASGAISVVLLALVHAALALLAGAATGRRGLAIAVGAAAGVAAYVVNALSVLVDELEALRPLSAFHWYAASEPLRTGLHWGHAGVLATAAIALAALAVPAFARRDLAL